MSVQASSDFFTLAVVPDTQFASAYQPALLASQTRWLAAHRASERISMVMQEGDIVNTMRISSEWATARRYYDYLDGTIPFVAAAGNHDIEALGSPTALHEAACCVQRVHPEASRTIGPTGSTTPTTTATPTTCSRLPASTSWS